MTHLAQAQGRQNTDADPMKRRLLNLFGLLPLATAALAVGASACDDDHDDAARLFGNVDQQSFSHPVTRIIATADDGTKTVTAVATSGAIEMQLRHKQHYTFEVDTDAGSFPLVLAGAHGRYVRSLEVRRGGAQADLGVVRFYDPSEAPYTASNVCVDGYFEDSLEPCMTSVNVSCNDDDDKAEDATLGMHVDLDEPMAVPSFSLPASIGCKRGHGDDDDGGDWDDDDGHHDDDD